MHDMGMWKLYSRSISNGGEVVLVGMLGVLCILSFSVFLSKTVLSATPPPSAWFCGTETYAQVSNSAIKNKFASSIDFFTSIGTPLAQVLCSIDGRAYINVGNENPDLLIYKFAYERDHEAKKWRKTELSGDKSTGPWLLGFASTELKYVPKDGEDEGEVLIYTCQQVQGVWKCGCSDRSCLQTNWQLQTYSTSRDVADEEPADEAELKKLLRERAYGEHMDEDYLSVYGMRVVSALPGTTISGEGGGLRAGMSVHFDDVATADVTTIDNTRLSFVVPYVEPGVYTVWFTQDDMRSRNFKFTVKNENTVPVIITSVQPESLRAGDTITVTGSGFTPKKNVVKIGAYNFSNLASSDGKTIVFKLIPDRLTEEDIPQEVYAYVPKKYFETALKIDSMLPSREQLTLPLRVSNSNGSSNVVNIAYK